MASQLQCGHIDESFAAKNRFAKQSKHIPYDLAGLSWSHGMSTITTSTLPFKQVVEGVKFAEHAW